jgi:hypothetical protein
VFHLEADGAEGHLLIELLGRGEADPCAADVPKVEAELLRETAVTEGMTRIRLEQFGNLGSEIAHRGGSVGLHRHDN